MVASVPELVKRIWSIRKRRHSSSASRVVSATGWAKWVPMAARSASASTILGWAWPTAITPKPLW